MFHWLKTHWRLELVILTALAALTRFWQLFTPGDTVFDEVYFKQFAGDYLSGHYYFDIHPPLGKLLLGLLAHFLGQANVGLRLLPALAGTLIIPVFYVLLRQLKANRRMATLGAALLLLDNALLVESRFVLIDSMLILFGLTAVSFYLAARARTGTARWIFLALAGFAAGLTASTKWTGLTALALILIAWFVETPKLRDARRKILGELAALTIIPIAVYVSVFAIHFALLPKSGDGDAFMSPAFQATLIGSPSYNPAAKESFWNKFTNLNYEMEASQSSLKGVTHPYGSRWYTWPLMRRPIYYWQGVTQDNGSQGNIYLLGNPFVWWGILVILGTMALVQTDRHKPFQHYRKAILLLITAYLLNFLPFIGINRVMFLYHYFFAFIFSLALAVIGLGALTGWNHEKTKPWRFKSRQHSWAYWGILVIASLSFLYFAPLSYGWAMSPGFMQQHFWLTSWR